MPSQGEKRGFLFILFSHAPQTGQTDTQNHEAPATLQDDTGH